MDNPTYTGNRKTRRANAAKNKHSENAFKMNTNHNINGYAAVNVTHSVKIPAKTFQDNKNIKPAIKMPAWLEKDTSFKWLGLSWQRWFDLVLAIISFLIAAIYPFKNLFDLWQLSWIGGGLLSLVFCITGVTEKLDAWGKKTAKAAFISVAMRQ